MKKTKEYVNIRIRKITKDKLDVLGEYLDRKIINLVDDCVGMMQIAILRNEIAERERQAKIKATLEEKKDV